MSIFKNNLRTFGPSVRSGVRSTNSKIINWVCATFLAGLILFLFGSSAKADNVLANPGAEQGFAGWIFSDTGYFSTPNTNSVIPGYNTNDISMPGFTTNYLAHSGTNTFQLFDTTGNNAVMYQDYPAQAGSQWSASCWAICYASNYFDSAFTYMSVAFYDTNGMLLGASFDPGFSTNGYGVYATAILDPKSGDAFPPYIFAPPQATNALGWVYLQATNFWYSYTGATLTNAPGSNIETVANVPTPVSSTFTAPPGTAFVRYQLEYDNASTDGGAVCYDDCVLNNVTPSDPTILNPQPAENQQVFANSSVSFTVNAIAQGRGETLTYQWQKNGTNLPPAGLVNDIQGPTTNNTLYLTNCVAADAGVFACWVTDASGKIRSVPVNLSVLVLTPLQKVNALGPNAGFDAKAVNPVWAPWNYFNGIGLRSTANFYDFNAPTPICPVNVYDGNWCALVGDNGDRDNGFWQMCLASPGTAWKAGGYAYISSCNDYTDGNTCRLQIWFKDSLGNAVPGTPTFESFKIYGTAYTNAGMQYTNIDVSSPLFGQVLYHTQLPRDAWVQMPVTNVLYDIYDAQTNLLSLHNGVKIGDDIPSTTWSNGYFMVPTNIAVANINLQVYEYCPVAADTGVPGGYLGNAIDSVYWDDMYLIQIVPLTNVAASVTGLGSGRTMNMSFSAGAGLNYIVLYKTNLTDATWNTLGTYQAPSAWQNNVNSIGTSTNIMVSDTIGTTKTRFYRVQVE